MGGNRAATTNARRIPGGRAEDYPASMVKDEVEKKGEVSKTSLQQGRSSDGGPITPSSPSGVALPPGDSEVIPRRSVGEITSLALQAADAGGKPEGASARAADLEPRVQLLGG